MALSTGSDLQRIISAARSPGWSIGEGRRGLIMATRDSGQVGMPWVVTAERNNRGLAVSIYEPGDDVQLDGEFLGQLVGNARELGRGLRTLLEDCHTDRRA